MTVSVIDGITPIVEVRDAGGTVIRTISTAGLTTVTNIAPGSYSRRSEGRGERQRLRRLRDRLAGDRQGRADDGSLAPVEIRNPPVATADAAGRLGGTIAFNLLANDTLGIPAATLMSFGGGSLGGLVTSWAAGSTVPVAGGTLRVDAGQRLARLRSGAGLVSFTYRLENAAGTSDAVVHFDACLVLAQGQVFTRMIAGAHSEVCLTSDAAGAEFAVIPHQLHRCERPARDRCLQQRGRRRPGVGFGPTGLLRDANDFDSSLETLEGGAGGSAMAAWHRPPLHRACRVPAPE